MIAKHSASASAVTARPWIAGLWLAAAAMCASAYASETDAGQHVPASLMACASEADSVQRLACFDREIQRLSAHTTMVAPAAQAPAGPPAAPAPAASAPAATPPIQAAATSPSAAVTTSEARHIRARVERAQRDGDNFLIVRLDNNQTWRQEHESPAELHVKAGDAISIDREMGAYYLTDRLGTSVVVRRIEP